MPVSCLANNIRFGQWAIHKVGADRTYDTQGNMLSEVLTFKPVEFPFKPFNHLLGSLPLEVSLFSLVHGDPAPQGEDGGPAPPVKASRKEPTYLMVSPEVLLAMSDIPSETVARLLKMPERLFSQVIALV